MLAVSEHDISHISDSESVHKYCSCVYFVHNSRRLIVEFQHISGLDDKYILFRDAERFCHLGVCFQVTVFTMHRDRILRFYKRVDQFQLFLAGMARHMGILKDNFRAFSGKLIDHAGY